MATLKSRGHNDNIDIAKNCLFRNLRCNLYVYSPYRVFFFFPTGGADKSVVVFDAMSQQILATLKGHTKKVTNVVFHPSQVLYL